MALDRRLTSLEVRDLILLRRRSVVAKPELELLEAPEPSKGLVRLDTLLDRRVPTAIEPKSMIRVEVPRPG